MSYWYKRTNVKDYVVALNAVYNISRPDTEDLGIAEDEACNIIEEELKKRDIDEIDIYIVEDINSLKGYIIKVSVNMVVPAVASNYDEALSVAESFVDDIEMPECVTGISIGTWDAELKEDRGFLLRCKGA